jgi:hypothetical protein
MKAIPVHTTERQGGNVLPHPSYHIRARSDGERGGFGGYTQHQAYHF